jgi:hypothetical protein
MPPATSAAMLRRRASIQASAASAYRSAPVRVGGQAAAIAARSTSGARSNLRVRACSTCSRTGQHTHM